MPPHIAWHLYNQSSVPPTRTTLIERLIGERGSPPSLREMRIGNCTNNDIDALRYNDAARRIGMASARTSKKPRACRRPSPSPFCHAAAGMVSVCGDPAPLGVRQLSLVAAIGLSPASARAGHLIKGVGA